MDAVKNHRFRDMTYVSGEGWRWICSCGVPAEPVRSSYAARKDWVWHAATAHRAEQAAANA